MAWAPGDRPANPHVGAWSLRHARPYPGARNQGLGPLGARDPAHAARDGPPRGRDHGGDRARSSRERRMTGATDPMLSHDEAFVELENATVTYGGGERAVNALAPTSLRMGKGDFVALVGPSGCGKSTILKLVSGLIHSSSGHVFVAGREVGAEAMRVGMAFQNATLLPWLRIRDNVMLPLKIVPPFRGQYRRKRKTEFRDRADALLAKVGLAGFGDKYPWQLSGGMLPRP